MAYEKEVKVLEMLVSCRDPFTGEHLSHDHILCRLEVNAALWTALGAVDGIATREKLSALQTRIRKLREANNLHPITGRKLK